MNALADLAPRSRARRVSVVVRLGLEVAERQVLELGLDPADAEPVGERGVDLERLARDALALRRVEVLERAHVVQAIGELDQDDPDVVDHGQDHLAEVLGLGLLLARELELRDLGHALDDVRDVRAEVLARRSRSWSACPRRRRAAGRRRRSPCRAAGRPGCRRPRADARGTARPSGGTWSRCSRAEKT